MIVTLTGANVSLRHAALKELVAAFIVTHGDLAVERFDGEEASAERMRESLSSMPFLSDRKLVILREPSKQKVFTEAITDILGSIADSSDVILHEPKLDKRSIYYKTLKKDTDLREYAELDAAGLSRWARTYVTDKGGSITASDATFLVERVGTNQQMLATELDKLLTYDPTVNRATIELLTEKLPQSTVFELLDAAFASKADRAFALYREQRALRVEPQAILAMVVWQLHILAVVKAAGVRPADQIAKDAKLNPFVVRKTQAITRSLTMPQIKQMVADLLMLDMQLKRTSIDADEALQLFLLRLAQR